MDIRSFCLACAQTYAQLRPFSHRPPHLLCHIHPSQPVFNPPEPTLITSTSRPHLPSHRRNSLLQTIIVTKHLIYSRHLCLPFMPQSDEISTDTSAYMPMSIVVKGVLHHQHRPVGILEGYTTLRSPVCISSPHTSFSNQPLFEQYRFHLPQQPCLISSCPTCPSPVTLVPTAQQTVHCPRV